MKVLVACEESQRVCIAFREKGHEAYSCDIIKPSGGHPEWHIKMDVLKILNGGEFTTMDGTIHNCDKWDLMIAHPPCIYLSIVGAYIQGILDLKRYRQGLKEETFFEKLLNADCKKICVEILAPVKVFHLPKYSQIIQPFHFGEPWSKRTCLWLRGLPPLKPTCIEDKYKPYVSCETSAGEDKLIRSKTFWGIARAMAEQWGDIGS